MTSRLVQLQQRIEVLEALADEIASLVERYYRDDHAIDSDLSLKGQRWYRGCRELLAQHRRSGLGEFDECYRSSSTDDYYNLEPVLSAKNRGQIGMRLSEFWEGFRKARSIVQASRDELLSRELPILTQLSFAVAENEFKVAQDLVATGRSSDAIIRAAGVVARVALGRHLWTVSESRALTVGKNPPTKRHADVSDVLTALVKEAVITEVQRSHLDSLFAVANNCAHPKEAVRVDDVERLIREGSAFAGSLL